MRRADETQFKARAGLVLLLLVAALASALPYVSAQGSDTPPTSELCVQYHIDRSAVPGWVRYPSLTLLVPVGAHVQAVAAWSEAGPIPVTLDTEAGLARLTTTADHVLIKATGENLTTADLGPARKAVLKDDKAWAYSLTFDDGQYSVYQMAHPELSRYGFRAGVAVIGLWMAEQHVPAQSGYMDADELLDLVGSGWSLFNHSYNHSSAAADINLNEAHSTQQAIATYVGGYKPVVFTAPYVSPLWGPIIDANEALLGIHLLQAYSDGGPERAAVAIVDQPLSADQGVFHIGRDDIKNWIENGNNYFDRAHGAGLAATPQHSWVSLHGHKVTYDKDWCAVAASSAYLYNVYGPGGTNEVWVAPADEVYSYWVVRSSTNLSIEDQTLQPSEGAGLAPQIRRMQYGYQGYTGAADTFLEEAHPTTTHGGAHGLSVGSAPGSRTSALLHFELSDLPPGAVIQRALLSVYASWHSNVAGVDLQVAPLLTPWSASEATWRQSAIGVSWTAVGALSTGNDRGDLVASAHVQGAADSVRWYSFDVTSLVRAWYDGDQANRGVVIQNSGGVYKTTTLIGSRHPEQTRHPKLIVEYSFPEQAADPIEPTPSLSPTATATPFSAALPLLFAH